MLRSFNVIWSNSSFSITISGYLNGSLFFYVNIHVYSLFSEILYSLKVYSPAKFVLGETDNNSDPLYIWWPFWYLKNYFMIQSSYLLRQNTPNFWFLFMWHYFHIPASCLSCSGDKLGCHHLYEVCSQKWTQSLDNQSWGAQGALVIVLLSAQLLLSP